MMGNNWCDDVGAVECRWTIKYGFCCDTNDDDVVVDCFVIVVWCDYDWLW